MLYWAGILGIRVGSGYAVHTRYLSAGLHVLDRSAFPPKVCLIV